MTWSVSDATLADFTDDSSVTSEDDHEDHDGHKHTQRTLTSHVERTFVIFRHVVKYHVTGDIYALNEVLPIN